MPNDRIPPEEPGPQPVSVGGQADVSGRDSAQDLGPTEEPLVVAESARNEAERFRQLAEEAREVRDQHREALETVRQERERLREAGESAPVAGEEARSAAEQARLATLDQRPPKNELRLAGQSLMNAREGCPRTSFGASGSGRHSVVRRWCGPGRRARPTA